MAQTVKNLPANAGDLGSIPEFGRSPGEGNGYALQYACLENATDRGAWQAISMGHKKLDTAEQTNTSFSSFRDLRIFYPRILLVCVTTALYLQAS